MLCGPLFKCLITCMWEVYRRNLIFICVSINVVTLTIPRSFQENGMTCEYLLYLKSSGYRS